MRADLKFAIRSLRKTPGFTAVAVLTVALGIGATVAIFSLVNAALLRPLPYAEPEQLARIYVDAPDAPDQRLRRFRAATTEYFQLVRALQSWQALDAWQTGGANFAGAGEPARITSTAVTGGLFGLLGASPALGRPITPADTELAAPPVAVISHGLWQRAFGGDPAVAGRDVIVNGQAHTVVGVMPERFSFPPGESAVTDVWLPLKIDPALPVNDHSVFLLGRLKPGVPLSAARAELETFVARRDEAGTAHRWDPGAHTLVAYGLHDEVVLAARPALRVLFGAVFFLLLIACVNVANLLLSRAEARQREIATRSALGAGVPRLAAQFAAEGMVLSALGTALGVLIAAGALELVAAAGAPGMPQALDARIDARVLLFAAATSALTGVLFALAPLRHVLTGNLHAAIRGAAAATTRAAGAARFRQALIVGQLALALILLTGTGLMLRTFWNLQRVNAGFDPAGVVTMSLALRESTYADEGARRFWARAEEGLAAIPGVASAALTSALPPVVEGFGWSTPIPGYDPAAGGSIRIGAGGYPVVDYYQVVSARYFDTLAVPLVEGRAFDARDSADAPKTAIINETLARAVWGDQSPLGRQIIATIDPVPYTIVGVVADHKNNGLDKPAGTAVFLPYTQVPARTGLLRAPYVAARAVGSAPIAAGIRDAVREIDATLPIAQLRALDEVLAASQSRPRFLTLVLTLFAGVSLALAAVGIYGVISYSVAQRARELGIRMALGARPCAVVQLEFGRGIALTAAGVLVGIAGAIVLTRLLLGFLFGVTATDPLTFAAVAALLASVAMASSYAAARRVTRVDPLVALRAE